VFNMYIFALDQSASHEYKFVYASDACSEASGHAARRHAFFAHPTQG